MWYLIVPPIVVILSLSFLLWYLSRKGEDPTVAQKVLEQEHEPAPVSFPRTKEFFLRMLEKSGQHFKVWSLRTHNSLHEFTQSVKASRVRVRTALTSNNKEVVQPEMTPDLPAPSIEPEVETRPSMKESDILAAPIVRNVRNEKKEELPRPMVSEVAVHPEKQRRVIRPDSAREEEMIARIARDPKDFTAYESLGDYYLEMNNIKDAKECYRQVLKLSPVHRMVKIKIRRLEKLLTRSGE